MKVRFVASDEAGGGRLRSFWPAAELRRRGHDAEASTEWPEDADVVVVHRPLDPETLEQVRLYRAAGVRVLVDEDDDLRSVPPENRNFHRWFTPERREVHERAIAEADGLIVSTDRLAEVYGPLAREVHVCRNHLPAFVGRLRPMRSRHDQAFRVGWAGVVKTHRQDLEWLAQAGARPFDGAILSQVGDPRAGRCLPHFGIETFPFQETPEGLYRLMARADVGIVPLLPCAFNVAKSWLKALEYMSVGVPVVATDLPEQRRLIRHGTDGFLASDPFDFAEHVQTLRRDPDLRQEMALRARRRAAELAIEVHGWAWEDALGLTRALDPSVRVPLMAGGA